MIRIVATSFLYVTMMVMAASACSTSGAQSKSDAGLRRSVSSDSAEHVAVLDYGAYKDVQVVYGVIAGWELLSTRCSGADCTALPLIRVRVVKAFVGSWSGSLVFEVPLPDRAYPNEETVSIGEPVVVTFEVETSFSSWSCGEFLSCEERPIVKLLAIEIYRVFRIPT